MGRDLPSGGAVRLKSSVSIHAPRVGRDFALNARMLPDIGVSIHAPRVGRDVWSEPLLFEVRWFQFTRPAWGATGADSHLRRFEAFQFTRPAWGATGLASIGADTEAVSIHAPRVGRDAGSANTKE